MKIQSFLLRIGISPEGLRFRQHLSNEMAHYATDCWDAECLVSSGWVECVGCADRSAYDLAKHEMESGHEMKALRKLSPPKQVDADRVEASGPFLSRMKNKKAKTLRNYLKNLSDEQHQEIIAKLETGGYVFHSTHDLSHYSRFFFDDNNIGTTMSPLTRAYRFD